MQPCKTLLLCSILLSSQLRGQTFERTDLDFSSTPDPIHSLEWIDADGDGDLDFLVFYYDEYNPSASEVKLFENTDGIFNKISDAFGGESLQARKYAFGDHDEDGDVDFLYIDGSNTLRLASNDGDLSFSLSETGLSADWLPENFYWQDLDGDGDYDVIWPSVDPYLYNAVYLNTNGAYVKSNRKLPGLTGFLSFSDVNNDGLTDVLAYESSPATGGFLYVNQGDAFFQTQSGLPMTGPYDNKKNRWDDFDADGDLDLFIYESGSVPVVYRNLWNESGTTAFEKGKPLAIGPEKIVVAGDFDLDGLPDLVMHGNFDGYTETRLFKNKSNADSLHFEPVKLDLPPHFLYSMDMLDFDGDHDLDLFFHGTELVNNLPMFAFFLSDQPVGVSAPEIPFVFPASTEHNTILSWNPVESGRAVSYVVQLMRNGLPYASGLAGPQGNLLAPEFFQPRLSPQALIRNLPEGDYNWRVAAINAAGISSGFSGYAGFSISPPPAGLTIEVTGLNSISLSWEATTPAADLYHIYRRLPTQELQGYSIADGSTTSWVEENVPLNLRHEYLVRAEVGGKYSAFSNPVVFEAEQYQEQAFADGSNLIAVEAFAADTDGDEDADLLLIGALEGAHGNLFSLQNDGAGVFTALPQYELADINGSYISQTADFDNDGDEDFCVAVNQYGENKVYVFQNNNGTFTKVFETEPHHYLLTMVVDDFNHDGLTDIIYGHTTGVNTQIYEYSILTQQSISEFTRTAFPSEPGMKEGGRLFPGDFNGDGFTDLLFANLNGGYPVRVFENLEGQAFAGHETAIFGQNYYFVFDYNQDGKDDVLTVSESKLVIFEGESNFKFKAPYQLNVPGVYGGIDTFFQSADLDLNGFPDLVITTGLHTSILQNFGDGRWWQGNYYKVEGDSRRTLLADREGDGDLDVFSFGRNQHEAVNSVIENRVISETNAPLNIPPSAPQNVQFGFLENGSPRLSWAPSSDDLTPTQYLSYNLHIEDAAGKVFLSGKTNDAGTYRRVIGEGNMGNRTQHVFSTLPGGSYTVKLQALDASFQLSAVAEFEFQIEGGPSALTVERVMLNKLKLNWSDLVEGETKVVLQHRMAGTTFETLVELPANTTTFTDEGLVYNEQYTYRLYALFNETPTAFSNEVSWNTQLFEARGSTLPGFSASIRVADFTSDGKMDLLVRGARNIDGSLQEITNSIFEYTPEAWKENTGGSADLSHVNEVFVHDFNGDFLPDIYEYGTLGDGYEAAGRLSLNTAEKSFLSAANLLTDVPYVLHGWWDVDGDNDLDPLVSLLKNYQYHSATLKNHGDNVFSLYKEEVNECYSCFRRQVATADFDNDGSEDLLDRSGSSLFLKLNKETGLKTILFREHVNQGTTSTVDYDGDGWVDVMIVSGQNEPKLYRNEGLGDNDSLRFKMVMNDFPAYTTGAVWADIDHDGDLDLVLNAQKLFIYYNEGELGFSQQVLLNQYIDGTVELIDFDDDGDLDIYLPAGVRQREGEVPETSFVLYNQLVEEGKGLRNLPPAPPANLSATQDVNGLHLNWTAPADDHTVSAALTYDIVITKNGKAVTKGPLHPETARRYKLAPGRNQSGGLLRDIAEVGLYSWKVQAIDPFMPETKLPSLINGFITVSPLKAQHNHFWNRWMKASTNFSFLMTLVLSFQILSRTPFQGLPIKTALR